MIQYVKQLFRGAASLVSTTLFTNVNTETTVVTSIAVCNTAAAAATYTLLFADVEYAQEVAIAAKTTHTYDDVRQVLTGTQTIKGLASAVTVKFHISGVTS